MNSLHHMLALVTGAQQIFVFWVFLCLQHSYIIRWKHQSIWKLLLFFMACILLLLLTLLNCGLNLLMLQLNQSLTRYVFLETFPVIDYNRIQPSVNFLSYFFEVFAVCMLLLAVGPSWLNCCICFYPYSLGMDLFLEQGISN